VGPEHPARLEVLRHRLAGVAEAMGAALQRSASSTNIKERLDFSCAVFDGAGRLLAQAAHIPVHLGAMPAAVAAARSRTVRWAAGDVVALNDPYLGGSHLPDITTVAPVFAGQHAGPVLFVATRAHHADVGGATPGSLPLVGDLHAEGLVLPPVRLVRGGRVDEDLLAVVCANSRTPDDRRGDVAAQLGAHRLAEERLVELVGEDVAAFRAAAAALLAHSERSARARVAELPAGRYTFRDALDDDGVHDEPLWIQVAIEIGPDGLHADFDGTAPQAETGLNAPLAVTRAAVLYVAACLFGDDVPINDGAFAAVRVTAPPGCLLNPRPPAAVAGGNVETSQRVVDVLLGALSGAVPDRIPAAGQGTMNNLTIGGQRPDGRPFTYYETLGGGAGAAPGRSGASGLQVHMTNTRNTPVEALEIAYPLRVEAYRLRPGSGGQGRWAGGCGLERVVRFLAPAQVTLLSERRRLAPWGLGGGGPGARGENRLVAADGSQRRLPSKGSFRVAAGDRLVIATPGGGGWGDAQPGCGRT
jgi:N-methylhydantoinase B